MEYMKALRFHFCHPVKGVVNFINKMSPALNKAQPFDTQTDDIACIAIEGLEAGEWRAALEWEYDGKEFIYEKDFKVASVQI